MQKEKSSLRQKLLTSDCEFAGQKVKAWHLYYNCIFDQNKTFGWIGEDMYQLSFKAENGMIGITCTWDNI